MRGWHETALAALVDLSRHQRLITSDDLHGLVDEPRHFNKFGAVFNDALRIGILRPTRVVVPSTRTLAKGRNIQVWESVNFSGERPADIAAAYIEQRSNQPSLFAGGSA